MTKQQVTANEGKPFGELANILLYKTKVLGVKADMSFWFINNKLYRASYVCSDKFFEPNTYVNMAAKWEEFWLPPPGVGTVLSGPKAFSAIASVR